MATTALKTTPKGSTPNSAVAPATAKAIEAVESINSAAATAANLAKRTVRFTSTIPDFVFREGNRKMEFRNGVYDATGDNIFLLRHAAARAWWLAEISTSEV